MQFSFIASIALSIASSQAYTLVISRDGAIFSKTLTAEAFYATIYDNNPDAKVYTIGDEAGSAAFYGNAASTSEEASATSSAVVETTSSAVAETTSSAAAETTSSSAAETTSEAETSEAASSVAEVAVSSEAASSTAASVAQYEGGAIANGVNLALFGGVAAVAALLI